MNNEEKIKKLETEIVRLKESEKEKDKWSKNISNSYSDEIKKNKELSYNMLEMMTMDKECPYSIKRLDKDTCQILDKETGTIIEEGYIHIQREIMENQMREIKASTTNGNEDDIANAKLFALTERQLKNGQRRKTQYTWMKLIKTTDKNKWQIVDQKDQPRYEANPQTMAETIKEITQNK